MFYNVLELKELPEIGGKKGLREDQAVAPSELKLDGFVKEVLLERGDSSVSIISLKKDEIIDNHISVCDALAYVYEGEAEFHFSAEKFEVKKGELIMFKKEDEHKVIALKDTKFMLIKI